MKSSPLTARAAQAAGKDASTGTRPRDAGGLGLITSLTISLESGRQLHWSLDFSGRGTLRMSRKALAQRPDWIALEHCQCPDCPLAPGERQNCPAAEVIAQYAADLANHNSYERVEVWVEEEDNRQLVLRDIQLQRVVGELVRYAVFQSGCPVGRKIKPAVTRLPPFPKNQEILQAFAVFFALQGHGPQGNGQAERFMRSLHEVFGYLARRLEGAGSGDAYLNGLVIFDSLSMLFYLSAPELIQSAISECRFW